MHPQNLIKVSTIKNPAQVVKERNVHELNQTSARTYGSESQQEKRK